MSVQYRWNDIYRSTPRKIVKMPFCLPQISNGLAWHRIWVFALKGRRLTV